MWSIIVLIQEMLMRYNEIYSAPFNKPMRSLNYEELNAFIRGEFGENEEGLHLDYKLEEPSDLLRHVVAFANTEGGIIMIGVDEMNRIPKQNPRGVHIDDETCKHYVKQIRDNVSPRIYPEIAVAAVPESGGASGIVCIRVHPSPESPHRWKRKGGGAVPFYRVGDESRELVGDCYLDLQGRMEISTRLSAEIEEEHHDYFRGLVANCLPPPVAFRHFTVGPIYPIENLIQNRTLLDLLLKARAQNLGMDRPLLEILHKLAPASPSARGALLTLSGPGEHCGLLSVSNTNQVLFSEGFKEDTNADRRGTLDVSNLVIVITQVWTVFSTICRESGYLGYARYKLALENVMNRPLFQPFGERDNRCKRKEPQYSTTFELFDEMTEADALSPILKELLWDFGVPEADENAKTYFRDNPVI